jgi:hypothetical protein
LDVFEFLITLISHGFFLKVEVTAGFALSQYLPCGVFMRFSVLCHRHEPDDYDHWQKGFYMKFDDVLIHSSVLSAHKCGTLKVAARAPKKQLDTLWRILLILLEVCLLSFRRLVADMVSALCLTPDLHPKISQLVNKMCSQQTCSKLVNKL